ncbi:MAG TPA: lysylphosphatidylglycerol synthase transmembrane domain-containing protein [Mycobacteriales bacterium]
MTAAGVAALAAAADPAPGFGADGGVGRPGRRWADLVRTGLSIGVAVALVVLLVRHRAMLDAGSDSVAGADLAWIGLAAAGTVLLWTAGTVSQLGSVRPTLPLFRLFAVQVAATFANHVLPGGSGGLAVNVRFLRRYGLSRGEAVGAVALNMMAGGVTHTALLLVALVAAPDALTAALGPGAPQRLAGHQRSWELVAVLAIPLAGLAVWAARRWGARALRHVRAQLVVLTAVVRTPRRAAQLWGGSLAVPVLHCLTLYAVLLSLGGGVPLLPVALAYLAASSLSALVPSPGGFGALDVALVAGLVAVGVPSATALATVLAYRLLTVWLPLVPGACVLAVLLRRRVI